MNRLILFIAVLTLSFMPQAFAQEDLVLQYEAEIKENITEGWTHLSNRDLAKSAQSFNTASNIVRMIRSKQLEVLLPPAPEGWTRKEKTRDDYMNEGAAGSIMGGMSMVSAEYEKGEDTVVVTIIGESPMIEGLMSLAALAPESAMEGKEKFKGGFLEFEEGSYENQISIMIIENATNVQIDGKGMTKEQGMEFANLLDMEAIKGAFKKKEEASAE